MRLSSLSDGIPPKLKAAAPSGSLVGLVCARLGVWPPFQSKGWIGGVVFQFEMRPAGEWYDFARFALTSAGL
jgi:hypothetical protein